VQDLLGYDLMMERAVRGVVREALAVAASRGLPGAHHFYITFRTRGSGVTIPDHLLAKYPEEMTIVLEHQFWDLEVTEDSFAVTLSFNNKPARLTIPFAAVSTFADPSVQFGLQFKHAEGDSTQVPVAKSAGATPTEPSTAKAKASAGAPGEVVTLDSFRKK
jgi:hypothetical protein